MDTREIPGSENAGRDQTQDGEGMPSCSASRVPAVVVAAVPSTQKPTLLDERPLVDHRSRVFSIIITSYCSLLNRHLSVLSKNYSGS